MFGSTNSVVAAPAAEVSSAANRLATMEATFTMIHLTSARRAKLVVFTNQLSSKSPRAALRLLHVVEIVRAIIRPALDHSLELAEICEGVVSSLVEEAKGLGGEDATFAMLSAEEVAVILNQLWTLIREAERQLDQKNVRCREELRGLLQRADVTESLVGILTNELHSLSNVAERLTHISLPHQLFTTNEQLQLLGSLLSSRPTLQYVDLSHCLLKDAYAQSAILPAVESLTQLSILLLSGNAFTEDVGVLFLNLLRNKHKSPSLQLCDLSANELSPALMASLEAATAERRSAFQFLPRSVDQFPFFASKDWTRFVSRTDITKPTTTAGDHPPPLLEGDVGNPSASTSTSLTVGRRDQVEGMVFDGGAMQSMAQVHYITQTREGLELAPATSANNKLSRGLVPLSQLQFFGGSSFGTIVAAAVAFGIDSDRLNSFFQNLAEKVFFQGHYSYYLNVAGRMVRDWWTGGNYYSAAILRAELEELFGARTPFKTPEEESALIFAAAITRPGKEPEPYLFRSYTDGHLRLVDVLLACCATATFFAPVKLSTDAIDNFSELEQHPNTADLVLCELCRYVSLNRIKLHSVSNLSTTSAHAIGVDTDTAGTTDGREDGEDNEPTATSLRMNPLLVKAVTTRSIDQAAAGKRDSASKGLPEAPAVLREKRLDTLAVATAESLGRAFAALHASSNCSSREDRQYHRLQLHSSHVRVKLDEDNTFLLNDMVSTAVADAWIPTTKKK